MLCTAYILNRYFFFAFGVLLLFNSFLFSQTGFKYSFEGNKKYTTNELSKVIATEWQKYLKDKDLSYVDDAAYTLLKHYRKNGHHFASVDYDTQKAEVIFIIEEQFPIILDSIVIRSEQENQPLFFTDNELKEFLTKPDAKNYFQKGQVETDISAISGLYAKEGFLQMSWKIRYDFSPEPPESQKVKVIVKIKEGPRSYLKQVKFQGNEHFSSQKLSSIVQFYGRSFYRSRMHQEMSSLLREFYRQRGYAQISIQTQIESQPRPKLKQEENIIWFKIEEGEKNFIRNVSVTGNEITDSEIILREVLLHSKSPYDLKKIRRSERNIQKTGLFLFAEIQEEVVDSQNVDLTVLVKERESRIVSFSLGYNTTYGVVGGIVYENINLLGTGRHFIFSLESTIASGELSKSEVEMRFIEPYLFDVSTLEGELSFFVINEETPTFTVFSPGIDLLMRKTFIEKIAEESDFSLKGELGYRLEFSDVIDVEDDNLEQEEGLTIISSPHQKLTFDSRDNAGYPTEGIYSFIELEQSLSALGADVDFYKTYFHFASFHSIGKHKYSPLPIVWAWNLKLGVVTPFGDTDEIPIQKKFFSGGATSVRSFQEQQLPPLDGDDNPVGGEGVFVASSELRFPIYESLGISVFADTGQVIPKVRRLKDYRLSKLEYAIGAGIWYNSFLGPIRFDFAFNPDPEENPLTGKEEDRFAWFISIGFSF